MFIILYWCYWPSVVYSRLEMLQSLSWEFTMMVVGSQYTKEYQLCGKYMAGEDWLIAGNFTGRTYVSISETVRWSWWLLYALSPLKVLKAVTVFDMPSDDKAVLETAFCDSIAVNWYCLWLLYITAGLTFIKPDQLDPWIKDQIGNALLSTILPLQGRNCC